MLAGYRVKDVIGIGGMAIVYRAEQVSLGREVALKVLSSNLSDDDAFRERFRREGRSVAALDHPNIVPIFDSGDAEGRLFLAMRLVHGQTLADRMRANHLSAEQTIAILRPIADALDAAHAAGIIHRDIKPQNILISSSGHPYLADFGIAKGATTAGFTGTGGFVGSFNYAAPEQILGREVTQAVDVYGLTAVLYQCLTGEVPYPRDTESGVLHAHVHAPLPSIPQAQPGAATFNGVIDRGLAKAPEARISSTGELIALAAEVVDSLPPHMRRLAPTFQVTSEPTAVAPSHRSSADGLEGVADAQTVSLPASGPVADVGDLTAVDQHRDDPVGGRDGGTRGRHWPRVLAAAGVAVLVAAGVVVLATSGGGNAQARTARSGPLSITYPRGWLARPSRLGSLFADSPIQLADGRVELAAGALVRSAVVPGGPPPTLRADFGEPIRAVAATVAGYPGRAYQWSTPNGLVSAFVLPLADGDVAVVCRGAVADDRCTALARDGSVGSSEVLPVGLDKTLARGIDDAIRPVASVRGRLGTLSESTLPARAASATRLANADRAAAGKLEGLNSPRRYNDNLARLRSALLAEATALSALASAGRAGRRSAYAAAIPKVEAVSDSLSHASRLLAALSLSNTTLPALQLAPPPKHSTPPSKHLTPPPTTTTYSTTTATYAPAPPPYTPTTTTVYNVNPPPPPTTSTTPPH
jgi:hypothetical protein